jgi:hypothetical protein
MVAVLLPRGMVVQIATTAMMVFALTGCQGGTERQTGTVSGQVTKAGTPLTDAMIRFYSTETGGQGYATLGPDGKYKVDSPMDIGTYRVSVIPPPVVDPADGSPPPKPRDNRDIPEKLREFETSNVSCQIQLGENQFNLDVAVGGNRNGT